MDLFFSFEKNSVRYLQACPCLHKIFIRSAIILKEDFWSRNSFITRKNLPKLNFTSFQGSFLRKIYVCRLLNSEKWHMVKRKITFSTIFLQMKGALCFFFSRSLKLLSIQFQQNWHFTEEDEYVKEHSLVRFPQYHWNAKQAEVLNCRPDIAWSCDSIRLQERV